MRKTKPNYFKSLIASMILLIPVVAFSESIWLDNILLHYTLAWVMFDIQKVQTVLIFPYNKQSSV